MDEVLYNNVSSAVVLINRRTATNGEGRSSIARAAPSNPPGLAAA